jgi:hypothetical protein
MKIENLSHGPYGWTFEIRPETPEEGLELEVALVPELQIRFPRLHNWIKEAADEVKRCYRESIT